jgi:DNA-binding XRE family transcriptional regulator
MLPGNNQNLVSAIMATKCHYCNMSDAQFPTSQGELLRAARGAETQTAFAKRLGVNKSSLSRYESEKLGAPTTVLNYCLKAVANQLHDGEASAVQQALTLMRRAAQTLERATEA